MSTNRNFILRSVYLSPEMDDVIRNQSFENKLSKNDLIRHYLEIGMRKEGKLPGQSPDGGPMIEDLKKDGKI